MTDDVTSSDQAASSDPAASSDQAASELLAQLNEAQQEVVQSTDGAQLVIAGPGSGKTRTLIFRVAYLVQRGVAPESILLLTFTRRAAQEMLRRATSLLDDRCGRVAGGTFHSFANQVLRRHGQQLGYGPSFTILDRSDAADLVGVVRTELGHHRSGKRFPRKETLLDLFSRRINTSRKLEDLLVENYPHFLHLLDDIRAVERGYGERKHEQNVMDYDDLLVNLRDLLVQHEAVRRQLASAYRFVMVDEYQDTNRLQAHIAALLATGHGNLMVVGDDAQSIYSFRGADFRNIMDFPKLFPDARQVLLERNYRSTQAVLDLANALLSRAREKFDKRLFTRIEGGELPAFVRAADDVEQARFICQRVLQLREEGVPLGEIAVLCRAAWHSNSLELELSNAEIPFRKFGGQRFVEAAHVKDVTALLKLATNPQDTAAWFRILQLFEGVGPQIAQNVASAVAAAGGDISELTSETWSRRRYADDFRRLAELLESISEEGLQVSQRVDPAIEYCKQLLPSKYDDAPRRARDLETVQHMAARYTSLENFLADLAIDPPQLERPGQPDPDDECLTVSTVHSAKGLEWHAVFVLHLNEGQFPSYNSLQDPDAMEEERRLLYVAVTRAKRELYLLQPEQVGNRGRLSQLSPFLDEIPDLNGLTREVVFTPEAAEDPWAAADGEPELKMDEKLLGRISDYFKYEN